METVLWVIGIHLIELLGVAGYFLISKNTKLTNALASQQQYIDSLSIVMSQLTESLSALDQHVWVQEDEELKTIFSNVKEIQVILKEISNG
jgi:hypothetical protein